MPRFCFQKTRMCASVCVCFCQTLPTFIKTEHEIYDINYGRKLYCLTNLTFLVLLLPFFQEESVFFKDTPHVDPSNMRATRQSIFIKMQTNCPFYRAK